MAMGAKDLSPYMEVVVTTIMFIMYIMYIILQNHMSLVKTWLLNNLKCLKRNMVGLQRPKTRPWLFRGLLEGKEM